jgi:chromosome segregation protein
VYLKRLDVQGFKSFGNKTQLQFSPGVTCVVGPNGTGKTNVADSLRWVLGEHASRTLRARKTEDVIFAGSDKRAPMGLAEVSITLDNSGHWLPIDFDEVVVTRRAYRSGDNEYLINNSKVRLKDVVDLFMRAQVGQNSYAFMGQGMVEQVLSLRPEDRRALIEEAADVHLYRSKLEDAQRKLKATRENMDRVRMLVREIEPRINQLERQAGRALKYQDLARELASTLHVWYAHQWQELNSLVLAAGAGQEQRNEDFERAKADAKHLDDGLVQLRAAIDERKQEIALREGRLRTMQDYVRDLERRAALDGERGKMLAQRIDELARELESLRADEAAQDATESAVADTSALEAQLEEARAELATHRARLAEVEAELLRLQRAALASEQAAARALAASEDLGRRMTDAADTVARLRRERDAAVEERRKTINELAAWAKDYARISRESALLGPQIEWAAGDRAREADAIAMHRRDQAAADDEMRAIRAKIDALSVRLEMLQSVEITPAAPDAGVRAILEAGGVIKRETVPVEIELSGVKGLLAQIVRVPSGLERAIEAALAENLYAVVMERESDVRKATTMLLGGDTGRATMYALDNIQETRPLHLIKERGIVGVASGLVRCDHRYRKLIDTILGRTVVVEDLALAQRVIRRGLASAVATLDGVLVRTVGSVTAGTMQIVETSFAHDRELDDIPEQIARLQPQLDEKQAAFETAVAAQQASERRIDELAVSLEDLREKRSRIDAELSASKSHLASFRARLQNAAAGERHRDERIAALTQQRAEAEALRDAKATESLEAAEREREQRAQIAALEAERTSLADKVGEQAAAVAALDGAYRSERQATEGERMARERLARQIAEKDAQRVKTQEEARSVASRLATTERELTAKTADVDGLRTELEPAREELAQFESRERQMTAQLAEANEKLRTAERGLVDAENEVRIRTDELEALRQNLEAEGFVTTEQGEVERAPELEPEIDEREPEFEPAEAWASVTPGEPPSWLRASDDAGDLDLPPIRGGSTIDVAEVRDRIADLRAQIRSLGPINEEAATEYEDSRERFDFLSGQLTDLTQAEGQLHDAITELEGEIRERFRTTFKTVNREFERYFNAFFRGGTARLELGETDEDGLPGIEIIAQPPGKKLGSLALLSGGERSLTAVALLFALLQANPSPICVLDEVDAALDEANVGRFVEELRALAARTQFIIITHNRRTIENADTIYGVSMGADNVSRVLSLKLEDVHIDEA